MQGFYEQVNQEADGPQVATRLLAHKIQSPQQREALQALTVRQHTIILLLYYSNNYSKTPLYNTRSSLLSRERSFR
uniref:VHS domain-containing protein n=1 Tax=Hucho hucho TaxID=62062 RepID=A0A4W5L2Z8_9TELE